MNICVYGASGTRLAAEYFDAARELGRELARRGHTLVFGGGARGLMGACAEGAAEYDGKIIGVAPRFFDEPGILLKSCTDFIYTDTMRERKAVMDERSDAIITMPGGIGTYEEFFEMLTAKQLGLHSKPMVLLNTLSCYAPLIEMLEKCAEDGFMSRKCMELFSVCPTPSEAVDAAEKKQTLCGSIKKLEEYAK